MKFKIISFILLIVLIIISIILIIVRFSENEEIKSITKIYYSFSGGMAYNSDTKYELICGEECILNIKIPYQLEKKNIIISKDMVSDIIDIFNKYHVSNWNNFNKSDNGVLDGNSFSFSVTYNDGKTIDAHGYMKYPKNYHEVISYLKNKFEPLYNTISSGYLFDLDYYKGFNILKVNKIIIEKHTVAGIDKSEIEDRNKILDIYNQWKNAVIGNRSKTMCDDNTIIYRFIMNDKKEYRIEKECDNLVIDNTRYNYDIEKVRNS